MEYHKVGLGRTIRCARLVKHLSQEDLAELVGITPTHMKHIESEHRKPSVEVLYKLVRILNISLDDLFFPEQQDGSELRRKIERRIRDCDIKQLQTIDATIEAILLQ